MNLFIILKYWNFSKKRKNLLDHLKKFVNGLFQMNKDDKFKLYKSNDSYSFIMSLMEFICFFRFQLPSNSQLYMKHLNDLNNVQEHEISELLEKNYIIIRKL